jgi:DNA replication protein DnaC
MHPQNRDLIRPAVRDVFNGLVTGRADWPLYLWGDTGRGKTSAALCLVNAVADSYFCTLEEVASLAFSPESWFWRDGAKRLLLIVDEIGLRDKQPTEYEHVGMERLADLRQFEPTLWLSNLSPEAVLARYGDRVYSRICSGSVVHHGGGDRRFSESPLLDHLADVGLDSPGPPKKG